MMNVSAIIPEFALPDVQQRLNQVNEAGPLTVSKIQHVRAPSALPLLPRLKLQTQVPDELHDHVRMAIWEATLRFSPTAGENSYIWSTQQGEGVSFQAGQQEDARQEPKEISLFGKMVATPATGSTHTMSLISATATTSQSARILKALTDALSSSDILVHNDVERNTSTVEIIVTSGIGGRIMEIIAAAANAEDHDGGFITEQRIDEFVALRNGANGPSAIPSFLQ